MSISILNPLSGLGRPIDSDRPCHSCGYNLKGLKYGDRCPECGTPARSRTRHEGSRIFDSPMSYLRRLRTGAVLLVASAFLLIASVVWLHVPSRTMISAGAVTASLIPWCIGVWIVTAPRPKQPGRENTPEEEWKTVRLLARTSQLAGMLSAVLFTSACVIEYNSTAAGTGPTLVEKIAFLLAGTGFVLQWLGAFAVCEYLARLADWAEDDELMAKLRTAMLWLIPAYVLGLAIRGIWTGPLGPLFFTAACILSAATAASCLFALLPLARFARLAYWAVKNTHTSHQRDQRVSARIVKRIEDGLSKPRPGEPRSPKRGVTPTRPQGYFMAKPADEHGYDIAQEGVEKPPRT